MKKSPIIILSTLIIGSFIVPVMAQVPTVAFAVHLDFYSYSCALDDVQVSLYDQMGRLVGASSSHYGTAITIVFRTSTSVDTLTARAFGRAIGTYYTRSVSGTGTVKVGNGGGDYWIPLRMF